jgi:hypothetical protein
VWIAIFWIRIDMRTSCWNGHQRGMRGVCQAGDLSSPK